ncbi:hypothetical protein HZH68_009198 [Vespula germanica]|uniref:Uncharacterized protein n=1 Tax=Vespula germanica TaxID=30212 RepID=A0A834K2G7_VESGE|nr:hypothetical protein HZH68_009198 [Vespula germanica]
MPPALTDKRDENRPIGATVKRPVNAAQLRADTNDTLSHLSRYDSTTTSSITNTTTSSISQRQTRISKLEA